MKKIHISAIAVLTLSAVFAHADYTTAFPSGADADFQWAAIGQHGTEGAGGNNEITWNEGSVILMSKYFQPVSRMLIKGDNGSGADDGRFSVSDGELEASLSFDYFAGDSDSAMVEVALNASGLKTANNYPAYYARVSENAITITRHEGYGKSSVVATEKLATKVSGSNLILKFKVADVDGNINLSAELHQNGVSVASVSGSDSDGFKSGYAGFGGGDARNSGTKYGIMATGFTVRAPVAVEAAPAVETTPVEEVVEPAAEVKEPEVIEPAVMDEEVSERATDAMDMEAES